MIKVKIIDLGREKVNKVIEINSKKDLLDEVSKHLASSEIDLHYLPKSNMGYVVVGGFRTVGKFKPLETEKFKKLLKVI
jgi:hypothetical protein